MQIKQNLHIHTTYGDGRDTPEQIILEAIARGFDSIGFSEHSYMEFSTYPGQMTPERTLDYRREIAALREKYRARINVFCGLEMESYSTLPTEDFRYVIGSVHYLEIGGEILGFDRGYAETVEYIRRGFGGDGLSFARCYFERVAALPECCCADIVGHFDLLTKNNERGDLIDITSREYLSLGREAIHALAGRIPLFEVNTGAVARGYRTSPYPALDFVREFRECGFGAVITSDCHDKRYLDCAYADAEELLRAAGYRSIFVLTDSGFCEVGL